MQMEAMRSELELGGVQMNKVNDHKNIKCVDISSMQGKLY